MRVCERVSERVCERECASHHNYPTREMADDNRTVSDSIELALRQAPNHATTLKSPVAGGGCRSVRCGK